MSKMQRRIQIKDSHFVVFFPLQIDVKFSNVLYSLRFFADVFFFHFILAFFVESKHSPICVRYDLALKIGSSERFFSSLILYSHGSTLVKFFNIQIRFGINKWNALFCCGRGSQYTFYKIVSKLTNNNCSDEAKSNFFGNYFIFFFCHRL